MPAQVNVTVQLNENGTRAVLTEIDQLVNKLNGKKINISVNATGQQISQLQNVANNIGNVGSAAQTAAQAVDDLGDHTSRVVKIAKDGTQSYVDTYKKGVAETVKISSDGTKKITYNYEAQAKAEAKASAEQEKAALKAVEANEKAIAAQEKANAQWEKDTLKAIEYNSKAYDKYVADQQAASEAQAKAATEAAKAEQAAADKRLATMANVAKVAATAFLIKETKEALSTMKDVDSELANIRKVTGESEEVIKRIGEAAYDTASKYGVSANEYLEAATAFAKAGKSNYTDLAELAIKTQLAGDVTADTASKFLLAADAAYKMNGNVDQLSLVLDRANELDNNYATSIEKIAAGFPIVANTASMANMSIEELMASLGTITAVTQQTGTKAATALRALILNITGEVGATLEDEEGLFTATQESVDSMSDALMKYGNEAVKTAKKLGKVVDPMEAIRSLAEAWKRGDLNEQELFNILSGVGGKLRTEQITALVKNFDMVESMLGRMEDAAGSADKEIANLLNTWDAKLERLGNTWAKLVSHIFNTDDIKSGLDVLIAALNGLDSIITTPLGKGVAETAALTGAFLKLSSVIDTIKKSSWGKAIITQVTETLGSVTGLTGAVEVLKATFSSLNAVSLGALLGELMTLYNIVNARGKINDDRFMYFYGQSTADTSGFGRTTDKLLAESAGDASAQVAALQTHVDKFRTVYNQLKEDLASGADPAEFEKEFGFSVSKFIKDFELAEDLIDSFGPILEDASDGSEELADGLSEVATAADEATKAIEAFNNATKSTKSGNADAYRSAYQQFLEDYKAGKNDTNVVRAAADMFLPENIQEALGYDLQAMGELLASDLYQGIYNGASENAGVDFVNYMADNMTEALDEIVNITSNKDGTYNFEYASAQKLADYFNLPLGAIQALIGALDEFGVQANIGWEEADDLANALGLVGDNAGKSEITLEGIARSLKDDFGISDKTNIAKMISALDAGGYLDGILGEITPEAIGAAISAAFRDAEIDATPENPPTTEDIIDTSQVEEAKEAIEGIPDEQDKTVNIVVTGLDDINSFKDWLETSPGTYKVQVNDDGTVSILMGEAGSLEEYLAGMGEGPYVISVNDDGSISVTKTSADDLESTLSETENPVVVTVGDDGSIESVSGKAGDLEKTLTAIDGLEGTTYTITINDPENAASYKETLEGIEGTYDVTVNEDGSVSAKVDVDALETVLESVEGDTPVTVTAEVDGTSDVEELADQESRVTSKKETVSASTSGKDAVDALASTWASIKSKNVEINATVHYSSSGALHGGSGGGFAEGTKYAPGGMALVNELGPELISDNGKAYIANGGKPAIVSLGKGAVVLTAEETRQALGNAKINNGINAYAGGYDLSGTGTFDPNSLRKAITGNSGTGATIPSKGSNGSGSGSGGGGGGSKSSSSSDSSSDPWKDKEDALKDALDELDELAEWYHNQKKHTEEGNTYADAIKKVDALRSEYLKAGFAETSKEVTTLANKIFDYEKDIAEAKAHAIDDLEDELDNLKSQIELAENQGDLNRMLELQNEAQKKVAELLEAYRAAGFDDTSPEILKLANMGYDYASDSGSTMKELWKQLIEALEDMRDTQDDANALAEKQLAVDEAREALQNAQNQRTVRIFNPVTGQWEWIADSKSIQQAQEKLKSAEESLLKEQQSQELAALKKAMENGGSLEGVTVGPGLSALLSGASVDQTNAFASALGVLSGGLATTADTSAKSIFDSVDSHDNVTQYQFNGVTIDANTAENTTLADLVQMITPLALTTNMPA